MQENYSDQKWIGQKYGRLTVIAYERVKRKTGKTEIRWIVRCECGTLKSVRPYKLIIGNTLSCGCHKREATIEHNKVAKTKHGARKSGSSSRLYNIWHGMKQRCYCDTCKDYANYGARGISICDEWLNDYSAFRDWSLAHGYADDLSIDRIDYNGSYSPDNCRWENSVTQCRNRRNNRRIFYKGKERTIAEISSMCGINYDALHMRIKNGWSIEDATAIPLRNNNEPNSEWRRKYGEDARNKRPF